MENDNNSFEFNSESNPDVKIYASTSTSKKKSNFSFSKNILIPFLSGVAGASIILGTCFSVPSIRNNLFGNSYNSVPNFNVSSGSTNTAISLANYSGTAIDVASKVQPSIVGIQIEYSVTSLMFGGYSSNATASGSGIIISEDGYILTNNHVVSSSNHVVSSSSNSSYYTMSEAQKITVKLYNSNDTYEAKIVGSDSQTDLAIIKIDATGLTPAELGDSNSVKVGEFAMAIGNPLGLDSSVTCGIVSAINREVTDEDGNKYIALQTDAAINSGNSGGALVNSEGKVIGINTLKLSGTGIEGMGFAIPINSTKEIYEQLIQYSKVKRPYIGITGLDLDKKTADYNKLVVGIYVKDIETFSAAEKAGIKIGDVIIAVDGKSVTTMDELNEIKNSHNIGDTLEIKLNRNGNELSVNVTLAEQP